MAVTFQILKDHGLVYVRYEGPVNMDDTMQAFAAYARHPDCRPGQKQLVDLSGVTEVEHNFPKLMNIQAQKASVFMAEGAQTIIVYLAPHDLARSMVQSILKSWEPFSAIVPVVVDSLSAACDVLGLSDDGLFTAMDDA